MKYWFLKFKPGQVVRFTDPPRDEFRDVLATVVELDEDVLRIRILPEYIERDERLKKRKVWAWDAKRFEIAKKLTMAEQKELEELKAKKVRTPVEDFILFGLESNP